MKIKDLLRQLSKHDMEAEVVIGRRGKTAEIVNVSSCFIHPSRREIDLGPSAIPADMPISSDNDTRDGKPAVILFVSYR